MLRCSLIVLTLLAPAPAALAFDVYHSPGDDGTAGPAAQVAVGGASVDVPLYISRGTAESLPAEKCSGEGDGDEVCGWDVRILAEGGARIDAFDPGAADVRFNLSGDGSELRANGLDAIAPATGPSRMGTLTVSATEAGTVRLASGKAVGSELAVTDLVTVELAVASTGPDADGDGVADDSDNCPVEANGSQDDADGDGIGDACECGDMTGDGFVNSIDARLIQRCAVGLLPCDGLCDATGESTCNSIDARLVQRLAVGILTKQDVSCAERPAP